MLLAMPEVVQQLFLYIRKGKLKTEVCRVMTNNKTKTPHTAFFFKYFSRLPHDDDATQDTGQAVMTCCNFTLVSCDRSVNKSITDQR